MRRLTGRLLRPRPASITAQNEITADAAAQAVWALLADASRWPQWHAACRWVHSSAPGPLPVGATFDWKAHPVTLHSVVTESVPSKAFRYTAASGGLHADHTFTLTNTPPTTPALSTQTQPRPPPPRAQRRTRRAPPARRRAPPGPPPPRATHRWLKTRLRQRPPRSPARSRARTQDLTACLA